MVAAAAAGRRRPGRWCTRPACTPPWPVCCSGSPCRCCAGRGRAPARAGRALRAPVPAAVGRVRGAGVRVLRRRRVTVGGAGGLGATPGRPGRARASSPAWWSARPSACSASTWLVQRFTHAELDEDLGWWDVLGLALLGGIGFTVSLLIGELAFGAGSARGRARQARRPGRLADRRAAGGVVLRVRNRALPADLRGGGTRRRRRRGPGRLPGRAARLSESAFDRPCRWSGPS